MRSEELRIRSSRADGFERSSRLENGKTARSGKASPLPGKGWARGYVHGDAYIDGIGDRRERNCPLLHYFGANGLVDALPTSCT
jgi:hypothetical protein